MAEQMYETDLISNIEAGKRPDSTTLRVRQGESIGIDIYLKRNHKPLQIPAGASCVLDVWTEGTTGTLYVNNTGTVVSATKGHIRFELAPNETNFTAGEYKGQARVISSGNDDIVTAWYGDFVVEEAPTGVGVGFVGTTSGLALNNLDDVDMTGVTDGQAVVASIDSAGNVTYGPGSGGSDNLGNHTATQNLDMGTFAIINVGNVDGRDLSADGTKLDGIESAATADQSDAEIETAYNNQVSVVSQAEAEAGTATTVRRWTAQRVAQAIAALAGGGGSTNWYSPMQMLRWDTTNATGPIGWVSDEITDLNYRVTGEGLETASGTSYNGVVRGIIQVPTFAASIGTTDGFKLSFFCNDVSSASDAAVDITVYGNDVGSTGDWGSNGSGYVYRQLGVTGNINNTPFEVSFGSNDFSSGAPILNEYYIVELKFYSSNNDSVQFLGGGLTGA